MSTKLDPERIITSKFGKKAKRKDCRAIKGDFYIMNEECFKLDGRWYRINSGFLVENISSGKWILKDSEGVILGIALNKEGTPITGYFSKNVFDNIPVDVNAIPQNLLSNVTVEGNTVYANSMQVVKKLELKEDISTGIFTSKDRASNKIAINGTYNFHVDYGFENSGAPIKSGFKKFISSLVPEVKHCALLGTKTFGLEFETTDGYIHPRHLLKTGLIPLRDGSISGYEYVTCPMKGEKGAHIILEAAKILKKYTTNNITCSLHLHIGNIAVNEKLMSNMYKTGYSVQKDVFEMFPTAMSHTSSYKDRDYCNKLPKIVATPKNVINLVSGHSNYYDNSYRGLGRKTHPNDEGNSRKWAVTTRYVWLNFVPYIFSRRGTFEFRIHTPTSNSAKLINWLFICAGIVTFAEKYASQYDEQAFSKLTLNNLIKVVYGNDPDMVEYLLSYIKWRKSFMKSCAERGDEIGNNEIMNDLDFKFPFKGKETLVST